jgi:hypothetical protein
MEKDFALKKTFDWDGQNFDPPAGVRIALGLRVEATLPAAFHTSSHPHTTRLPHPIKPRNRTPTSPRHNSATISCDLRFAK